MQTRTAKDIVREEVLLNASWLIQDLASGECSGHLAEQAQALSEPILDYQGAAIDAGWRSGSGLQGQTVIWHRSRWSVNDAMWPTVPGKPTYPTWEDACQGEDIEPFELEPCEFWAVTEWLANKLYHEGEKVCADFANLYIWARTTTGQAIEDDSVLQRIAEQTAQDTRRALGDTKPDMAEALGKLCSDDLRERLLNAQQDINFHANSTMTQSVAYASALIDEIEELILEGRKALAKARGESF